MSDDCPQCQPGNPYPHGDRLHDFWGTGRDPWADVPGIPQQRQPEREVPPLVASLRAIMHTRAALDRVPPPAWMIDGILTDEALSLLAGKFGTYKTFVALSWSCSIATGVPWFGHAVKRQGPVLYIAAEGIRGIGARLRAWERYYYGGQRLGEDQLYVFGAPVRINRPAEVDALCYVAAEIKPAMVVWDTLHRCAPGVEENSNTDMGLVVESIARIRSELHATQLVIHHTGHAGARSRGASNIEDDFEDSWVIMLADIEAREEVIPRTLVHRKAKDFALSPRIGLGLETADDGSSVVVERTAEADARSEEWLVRQRIEVALAGVPLTAGRPTVAAALRAAGIEIRNADLAELVRSRKGTPRSPELPWGEDTE